MLITLPNCNKGRRKCTECQKEEMEKQICCDLSQPKLRLLNYCVKSTKVASYNQYTL